MRKASFVALLLVACGAGRAVEKPLPPQKTSGQKAPVLVTAETKDLVRKMAPQVERFLREQQPNAGFPALVVGIIVGDELIWSASFGGRSDAPVRLGSITKVVTGLALLQLRDEGKLALDDPAVEYVPELAGVVYPSADSPPITIRQIITHTSGLPRMGKLAPDKATEKELLAGLNGLKLDFAPGVDYSYSNLGYALAGVIVARASGEPYRDYVARHILAPLGMKSTTWEPPAGTTADATLGAAEPAGGLWSTVDDAARLVAFELAAWPPRDDAEAGPVRRASVRESQKSGTWATFRDPALGQVVFHNGATKGYAASIWMLPARGLALVAFTNSSASEALDAVARQALVIVAEAVPLPEPAVSEEVSDALAKFVALMAVPDAKGVEELFAPSFFEVVPVEQVVKTLESANAGVCGGVRILDSRSSQDATARIDCPGGVFEVYLHVEESPPHKIDMARIQPGH